MTPVEHLRFSYKTKGSIDPEVLLTTLEEMELQLTVLADEVAKLRQVKSPGTTPYVNPEAR
jgi:hypothetical protein